MKKVNILGTEYVIKEQSESQNPKLKENLGICEQYSKEIIINDFGEYKDDAMLVKNPDDLKKKVLRHEIVHAFFGESGLRGNSSYAENEELVDWIAIQFPKMKKAFEEVGCL